MAVPTSRATLITYCKRQLGDGVIDINISTNQESDIVDDALQYYQDYHYDATERTFITQQVSAADITNKYLSISDSILGISNVYPISASSTTNLFNVRYQIRLQDIFDLTNFEMLHYNMVQKNLSLIDDLLVGRHPYEYQRHMDRLYIYMDWTNDIDADEYVLIECHRLIDPETYTQVYNDRWLKQYTTSLMKRQWGQNLMKYDGMTLPGGLTYNGSAIYDQASTEISELQTEMQLSYEEFAVLLTG